LKGPQAVKPRLLTARSRFVRSWCALAFHAAAPPLFSFNHGPCSLAIRLPPCCRSLSLFCAHTHTIQHLLRRLRRISRMISEPPRLLKRRPVIPITASHISLPPPPSIRGPTAGRYTTPRPHLNAYIQVEVQRGPDQTRVDTSHVRPTAFIWRARTARGRPLSGLAMQRIGCTAPCRAAGCWC